MIRNLLDLSKKIDGIVVEVIDTIEKVTKTLNMSFFLLEQLREMISIKKDFTKEKTEFTSWALRDSNPQPTDYESGALPLS